MASVRNLWRRRPLAALVLLILLLVAGYLARAIGHHDKHPQPTHRPSVTASASASPSK
jgi:hypothetical protein